MDKFKLNETGEKVAQSRYYQKNEKGEVIETWKDLVLRVVNHVCKNEDEKFQNKMIQIIGKTEFLPNSPCLVNAGRKMNKPGLMACYVSKAPEDTWDSMCDTVKNFGNIARVGGGCGLFLGNIRPEGDPVFGSTHAKACGPIEHMRMISEAMSSITQAGFRGMANLASLNVSHPDIINFIQCKQKERALKTLLKEDIFKHYPQIINNIEPQLKIVLDKFLHNFNISVLVSDRFMEAVKNDGNWDLQFNNKTYKTLKAKEIFNLITENAWKNGDPGCLFEDTINNNSPYRFSGQKINSSNPCQPSWAKLLTKDGWQDLGGVNVGDEIWSEVGWTKIVKKWSTGINKVYRYNVENGCVFVGTKNHRIVQRKHKIEVDDAEFIDCFKEGIHTSEWSISDRRTKITKPYKITSREYISTEETFDIEVDNTSHTYWTQGCNVSNCGEQCIPSNNSNCNLGSIDVSKFYNEKRNDVDWDRLKETIEFAFQFLDNVIDAHNFPDESFKTWGMENRPVGLGIMGFADLLLKLKIKYGSKDSVKFSEKLMKFFSDTAHQTSVQLAKERGTPKCCQYKELEFRRNVTTTSIAPTGSISLLAGCSSSIEPIFSATIFRHDNTGSYEIKHPDFESEWFVCALDNDGGPKEVKYQEHIAIQAAFQKYCDSAISKTINCPSSATLDDVRNAYLLAHQSGCKGITIYRNNSKTTQVLNLTDKIVKTQNKNQKVDRPTELPCDIFKIKADGLDWHIIIGLKNDVPYELFAVNGGKTLTEKGTIVKVKKRHYSLLDDKREILLDNIIESENKIDPRIGLETRRFSLELRHGIPPKYIVEQIDKSSDVITSFSKAAARIFKKHYIDGETITGSLCPECTKNGKESKLIYSSGCSSCPACFFSRCG